ncbi:SRPBCC family protein [Thalassobellus citreus]|uniref:SRPBCC family protein n=1 Tax=Thalassobellus citreus TaxID=3367752 RepID=UPI0037B974F7
MPTIKIKTEIHSDKKKCFDLARNIELHQESLEFSEEKAIAGKTKGLIGKDEWVCWEAKHLGFVQHLTSKITEFDEPNYFVDEMVMGAFKSFRHEHRFEETNAGTEMIDVFHFESPLGILGKIANTLFLKKYMKSLLKTRSQFLKEKAEALEK